MFCWLFVVNVGEVSMLLRSIVVMSDWIFILIFLWGELCVIDVVMKYDVMRIGLYCIMCFDYGKLM